MKLFISMSSREVSSGHMWLQLSHQKVVSLNPSIAKLLLLSEQLVKALVPEMFSCSMLQV